MITESATIANEVTTNQGEIMAADVKYDVNTEDGKQALEQINDNIERMVVMIREGKETSLVATLEEETEALISALSGKGSIKAKKESRDAVGAALSAAKEERDRAQQAASTEIAKTWDQYAGTVELANMGVERITEGVKAHVKVSHLAKDIAATTLEIWVRIPNSAGAPDLMGDSDAAKKASRAVHEKATEGLEDTYDNREALKKLLRSAQDQRSDARAEWLRSLDNDDETGTARREIMAVVLESKPEDEKASEWVANFYGTSTMGQTEKRRLEYQAKKALENKPEDEKKEKTEETATVDPDETLKKIVSKLYKDVESADVEAFEKASEAVKAAERKRLEAVQKAVKNMIATLI